MIRLSCRLFFKDKWLNICHIIIALSMVVLLTSGCGGEKGNRPPGLGDGGGLAVLDLSEPVTAGSYGTWTVRFIAGPEGIGEGGGIVVHLPIFWNWSEPQMASAGYPGYVTYECSRVGTTWDTFTDPDLHYVRATLTGGCLVEGDTVRFTYGDTLDGKSPRARARADRYAERGQEFLVKVDGDGDGFFTEIGRSPSVDILGGDAARLVISLKGEAALNDTTWLTVAALDRFGNLAAGYRGTVRFSHKWNILGTPANYTFTEEDVGARVFPVLFTAPGYQTIGVVEEGGTMNAGSNPIHIVPPVRGERYRLFWGDIHMHSRLSDGTGEPVDLYRYARDVSNLDVAALTDHDHHGLRPLSDGDWKKIAALNEDEYRPGRFVTFQAYEWTNWVYGHRNVYYRETGGPLLSTADSSSNSPPELWASLPAGAAMTIAHHTGGGPIATDWKMAPPPDRERLVEISSVHGASECLGGPKEIYNAVPGAFVRDALALGYRLGFIGSGDSHSGHPGRTEPPCGGLAGIYAEERTRESVWDALYARRTYATSGEKIILGVRLGDHWMGEEMSGAELADPLLFHVDACGTAPIDLIELIADGVAVDTLFGAGERAEGALEAAKNDTGTSWYYVRLRQMDGGLAWSSPIWVTP